MAKERLSAFLRRVPFRLVLLVLIVPGALSVRDLASAATPATVQPLPTAPVTVPLSDFADRDAHQLAGVQVKLTYLSEQTKPISTVVFGSSSALPPMAWFKPFEKSGHHYGNDNAPVESFTVGLAELKAMLQKANTIPAVQQGSQDGSILSFGVVDPVPGSGKGLQVILDEADAKALVTALQSAASTSNAAANRILGDLLARL